MSKPKDDLYATLGVAESASPDEIKKAFRALARECHPDVAGNDPHVAERFKQVRQAYDLLSDPVARAKYDRRRQAAANQRQAPRMPGGFFFWGDAQPGRGGNSPHGGNAREKHNDIDLEDLFSEGGGVADFGLGGGGGSARQNQGSRARESSGDGTPGRDIAMTFDVPIDIAERGGLVTAQYNRLRRSDDGESLFNYDELYDVRVPPGTKHGDTLRERAWGHAGANGGAYGDLVLDVRIVGATRPREAPKPAGRINLRAGMRHGDRPPERPQERPAERDHERPPGGYADHAHERPTERGYERRADPPPPVVVEEGPLIVPISVVEALLGGRIDIETPQGKVMLNLPGCTSGGARFRLRGKGVEGPDGRATDLTVQLRVVVPPVLDPESEELVRRFADLNPYNPRQVR
jgi:molecular chaperone DnaJ